MASKRKPTQPLLGTVAPAPRRTTFEDRGYGIEQTPWQKNARLARERAIHEATKANSDTASVLAGIRLGKMK